MQTVRRHTRRVIPPGGVDAAVGEGQPHVRGGRWGVMRPVKPLGVDNSLVVHIDHLLLLLLNHHG